MLALDPERSWVRLLQLILVSLSIGHLDEVAKVTRSERVVHLLQGADGR